MVAVRPSWVRVSAADGTVIFEGIMESGQSYDVPMTEEPPTLRAGESGAHLFRAGRICIMAPSASAAPSRRNLPLTIDTVTERFQLADLEQDVDLARMVAEAQSPATDATAPVANE